MSESLGCVGGAQFVWVEPAVLIECLDPLLLSLSVSCMVCVCGSAGKWVDRAVNGCRQALFGLGLI